MLETNRTLKNVYILLRLAGLSLANLSDKLKHVGHLVIALACALFLVSLPVHGQDRAWPQFRGPESNPVGTQARLAERWSKTENVEWSQQLQSVLARRQPSAPAKSQPVASTQQTRAQQTRDRDGQDGPPRRPKPEPDIKTKEAVVEALAVIQKSYVDGDRLKYDEVFKRSIIGMLQALDPHSAFYDKKEFDELKAGRARSEYYGIGATITTRKLRDEIDTYVLSTFENSPARSAGLRFGDRILEADGQSMLGKNSAEVRGKLRGPIGTVVRVTVERASNRSRETLAITREPVSQPTIADAYMIGPDVGYIAMTGGFNHTTSQELNAAVDELKSQGMTSLVLDLRNNSGGLILEAGKVAERFLRKDQTVFTQKGTIPASAVARRYASTNPAPETFPLVVVVNRSTASAAEILAGALQDHDRALIVGEKSFGKALVQSIIPLDFGTGLTLTTSRYYTPSGRVIQRDYSQSGWYDYYTQGGLGARENVSPPKGPASRTASGRPVFGGAITPDQVGIVKPREFTPLQQRLVDPIFGFARELINGRIDAPEFEEFQISDPPDLEHNLQPGDLNVDDKLLQAFKEYVATNRGLYKVTDQQLEREREVIRRQLRFDLATAAYGTVKAAQVLIVDDPQILRALQVLPEARDLAGSATKSGAP